METFEGITRISCDKALDPSTFVVLEDRHRLILPTGVFNAILGALVLDYRSAKILRLKPEGPQ